MQFEVFFKTYLDPLRDEVAEMGVFAGAHGRDKRAAEERVRTLARTAIGRSGVIPPTHYVTQCWDRLKETRESRDKMRRRLGDAMERLTGSKSFTSSRVFRKLLEGLVDLLVIPLIPLALLATWPSEVIARLAHGRAERQEGSVQRLQEAAEGYLVAIFDWHFDKGSAAASARPRPAPSPNHGAGMLVALPDSVSPVAGGVL